MEISRTVGTTTTPTFHCGFSQSVMPMNNTPAPEIAQGRNRFLVGMLADLSKTKRSRAYAIQATTKIVNFVSWFTRPLTFPVTGARPPTSAKHGARARVRVNWGVRRHCASTSHLLLCVDPARIARPCRHREIDPSLSAPNTPARRARSEWLVEELALSRHRPSQIPSTFVHQLCGTGKATAQDDRESMA